MAVGKFESVALAGVLLALGSLFLTPAYWLAGTLISAVLTSGALFKRRNSWLVRNCAAAVAALIAIRVFLGGPL